MWRKYFCGSRFNCFESAFWAIGQDVIYSRINGIFVERIPSVLEGSK